MAFGRSGRHGGLIVQLEKFRLGLRGRDMAERFQQAPIVEPIDPLQTVLPNPVMDVAYEALVRDPHGTQTQLLEALRFSPMPAQAKGEAPGGETSWRLFPSRSTHTVGEVSPTLIGFAKRFARQLEPLRKAYAEKIARPSFDGPHCTQGQN